ncbi:DUF1801 domain-containing protein [Candidatus Peregrinibacteria bacterium]|nr:DUF1801 domain-containing protein [Candidatus Peregrinibacteria bacterium]
MKTYKNIDEYISQFPKNIQKTLQELRKTIQSLAPEATEAISYGIPTFKLHGNLIHFAAYEKHIGLYPGAAAIADFAKDLTKYQTSKGTIQFPIDQPLPFPLIKKIVKYRVTAQLEK